MKDYAIGYYHSDVERFAKEEKMSDAEEYTENQSYAELQRENERLHTWQGLISILQEHYPTDIFDGSSGDCGAQLVVMMRTVDDLKAKLEASELAAKNIDRHTNDLMADINGKWKEIDKRDNFLRELRAEISTQKRTIQQQAERIRELEAERKS